MLTRLTIRNFKRFDVATIELGSPVVFIGPNNSGKSTALQALALWDVGLRRWLEKRGRSTGNLAGTRPPPKERPGVTINRRDLIAIPVPDSSLLWKDLHVRDVRRNNGSPETRNIRVDITVEGVSNSAQWTCGLEFDYANPESIYCRPLRLDESERPKRYEVPPDAEVRIAYLPPMSGLADREFLMQPGQVRFLIGQGRTAEILRNLCYSLFVSETDKEAWPSVQDQIERLFGVKLQDPVYIQERSEISMEYTDRSVRLDLSSSGRGLQQTLLLLSYLAANPNSVLLLDEPDAHLEILRQRQTYRLLTEYAQERRSQIIAASHSEVVLNEAADRDVVVAFLGAPHRIDDRGSQLLKALKEIGFDQYAQAEQTGWVLYVEGSTDLAILQAFAARTNHPAIRELERPFVHYVENQAQKARDHFYGLLEAKPDLVGIAIFDRLDRQMQSTVALAERCWTQKELENYVSSRNTLLAWAEGEARRQAEGPLFAVQLIEDWRNAMDASIIEVEQALRVLGHASPWSPDVKASDDFLTPLFRRFYEMLKLPNLMNKSDFHVLVRYIPDGEISDEVREVLDMIVEVSRRARPVGGR